MAALMAGVQYGLSSQGNFNENKSLIFVKLTDSAYRAIEEYIRNKNACTRAPTIQFQGNEGHLSLPSSQSARGTDFNFSLSSNEDIEGPQGSFECIQQVAPKCLESVGALHCKMRVQANDDVYDKTRQKMAEVEEMHKTKCTREIELDIGRRIKGGRSRMPSGGIPAGGGGASRGTLPLNGLHHNSFSSSSSSSTTSSSSVSSPLLNHHKPGITQGGGGVGGGVGGGLGGGGGGGGGGGRGSKDDITRRPIRDRLIHMLAVRPYKKPELHAAVQREGLREKDRNQVTATLSSIAMQRDNTYYLLRHVWNDVREDWPFYTTQDRQTLKRRKPQNLTPPGSSDGGSSTSSGQSPNSLQPGSPPSLIEPSSKRPGYIDGVDGFQTKRQRISRVPTTVSQPLGGSGGMRPNLMRSSREESNIYNKGGGTGGGGGGGGGTKYGSSAVRWTPSPTPLNQPPANITSNSPSSGLSATSFTASPSTNNYSNPAVSSPSLSSTTTTTTTTPLDNNSNNHHNNSYLRRETPPSGTDRKQQPMTEAPSFVSSSTPTPNNTSSSFTCSSSNFISSISSVPSSSSPSLLSSSGGAAADVGPSVGELHELHESGGRTRVGAAGSVSSSSSLSLGALSSSQASLSSVGQVTSSSSTGCNAKYLIDYPRIESVEDRRRYKTDFNTNYMEYRSLHSRVEKISRKFAALEESLKKEQKDSPAWKYIKNKILEEYVSLKKNKDYQSARQRFNYLHSKLSHIKQRVLEYDTLHCGQASL